LPLSQVSVHWPWTLPLFHFGPHKHWHTWGSEHRDVASMINQPVASEQR